MANRFYSPNEQFCDATGTPYAGGSLAFYASGTSTPLNTYSDSALTIANTNPVVLDSAGRAGNIFLQNLAYKVVLSDVNSNVIWTDDPVFSSDYSARAKFLTGSGSPNGNTAGTAGSSGIGADSFWDATNNILYICTTTGTALTAVWTAVNASSATASVPPPQGRLTIVSGTPVPSSGDIGSSTVYYTPYVGNQIPIYNGATFIPTTFSELSLSLVAAHAGSTLYDVFVFSNSGVLTLVTGPAWASSTAGSCSRGTGASTTQLARSSGLLVNAVQITGRNGSSTYTVNASLGFYVGTLLIDAPGAQVSYLPAYGTSRKNGIWNAYNRVPITLKAGDGTASWAAGGTSGGTLQPARNVAGNSITLLSGLPEEVVSVQYLQRYTAAPGGSGTIGLQSGIGFNSTTTASGTAPPTFLTAGAVAGFIMGMTNTARYDVQPFTGINVVTALEGSTASNSTSSGTETNMVMTAVWRS